MPKITYIQPDGSKQTVEVPAGQTVKDGAINHLVPGVIAECGGACACATCHVYVDEAWWDKVGDPNELEADMLEFANEVKGTSRLSCQIEVNFDLEGLVIHVPEE